MAIGGIVILFSLLFAIALISKEDMLGFSISQPTGTTLGRGDGPTFTGIDSLGVGSLSEAKSASPCEGSTEDNPEANDGQEHGHDSGLHSTGMLKRSVNDPGPVPFYLYPPEMFSGYRDCQGVGFKKETNPKFDTDLQLLLAFARHPWRVYNFTQAKVAIIPIPFNRLARGGCTEAYQKHIRNMKAVIGKQLYSKEVKHVVIANDWKTKYVREALRSVKPLLVAVKLHRARHKCTFGIGFSTAYANWRLFHSHDYLYKMPKPHAQRKYFVSFLGQVDGRPVSNSSIGFCLSIKP